MATLAAWTAKRLGTSKQTPFGAAVVSTADATPLMFRLNAVAAEHDPSSHAEVRVLRAACKRLKTTRLEGYTLYTTCEPCPMCMSMALWAGIDRVVYGATIADASRHCSQIYIPARTVARRSDMNCRVDGPVGRRECVALFEDPRMQAAMKLWGKAKTKRR